MDVEMALSSVEIRRRLEASSDTDDCRRFLRGLLTFGASCLGTTTADATGLSFISKLS